MIEFRHINPSELSNHQIPKYTAFELNYKKLKECDQAKIISIEELRRNVDEVNSSLRITIQLPENTSYELAQNIVIYPANPRGKVEKALDYLSVPKNDVILIYADPKAKLPFDNLLSIEEVLYKYIDLNAAPKYAK